MLLNCIACCILCTAILEKAVFHPHVMTLILLQPNMEFSTSPCESCYCSDEQDPDSKLNVVACAEKLCASCPEVRLNATIQSIAVF